VVGIIGDVDHSAEIEPGNVKTYHINMTRQYFHRRKPKHDSNAQLRNNIGLDVQLDKIINQQTSSDVDSHHSIGYLYCTDRCGK